MKTLLRIYGSNHNFYKKFFIKKYEHNKLQVNFVVDN